MRSRLAATLAAAALAGCAATPKWPAAPLAVTGHPLPPYQFHEECARLAPGDRLEYAFQSSAPVDFNIHYHDGPAVLQPIVRAGTSADAGIFPVALAQDYCAMWEAGANGVLLDYRLRIRRAEP